jgi:hypothetical protein
MGRCGKYSFHWAHKAVGRQCTGTAGAREIYGGHVARVRAWCHGVCDGACVRLPLCLCLCICVSVQRLECAGPRTQAVAIVPAATGGVFGDADRGVDGHDFQ